MLLAEGWELGHTFLAKFKQELAKFPLPNPYYPGIRDRWAGMHSAALCIAGTRVPPRFRQRDQTRPFFCALGQGTPRVS